MTDITPLLNKVHCRDALELMAQLPDGSVNAIITDLPYGTTSCSWDEIIPFEPMWAGVKRVLKPRGVFVTTASQPFTSKLVMSNLAWFKYEWVWVKTHSPHFLSAQYRPLGVHESVPVFSERSHNYYPIMQKGIKKFNRSGEPESYDRKNANFGINAKILKRVESDTYYPKTAISMSSVRRADMEHPTQKPLDLYKYLVLTYTQPGDVVLDFCAGSGTTAVAAATLNRQFIAGDTDAGYCAIARKRLETVTQDMFAVYGGFEVQP